MKVFVEVTSSPLGQIFIAASENGLAFVEFEERKPSFDQEVARRFGALEHHRGGVAREAVAALERYFRGDLAALDELACDAQGTDFQKRCWDALRRIPAGETRSYSQQAKIVGNPRAVRAVGGANANNPIPLVVPCHRVIGANGDLTGFASGLPRKKWLLEHERAAAPIGALPLFATAEARSSRGR